MAAQRRACQRASDRRLCSVSSQSQARPHKQGPKVLTTGRGWLPALQKKISQQRRQRTVYSIGTYKVHTRSTLVSRESSSTPSASARRSSVCSLPSRALTRLRSPPAALAGACLANRPGQLLIVQGRITQPPSACNVCGKAAAWRTRGRRQGAATSPSHTSEAPMCLRARWHRRQEASALGERRFPLRLKGLASHALGVQLVGFADFVDCSRRVHRNLCARGSTSQHWCRCRATSRARAQAAKCVQR